jgi:hypothetical protein
VLIYRTSIPKIATPITCETAPKIAACALDPRTILVFLNYAEGSDNHLNSSFSIASRSGVDVSIVLRELLAYPFMKLLTLGK